ncbi:MAG: hypothetical protein J6K47_03140 [Clostridia bacterium]|nr:hypothetical protein [Clostridia bacterium]
MRNSRTKTQTKLRNYIKLTAGALLLAITFVLVFAGTLSGAFGIESDLQQNGIIQSNVASAADNHAASTPIVISSKFSATNTNSFNINPDVAKRGKLWTTDAEICENNTWTMGDGSTGGTWTIADKNRHSGNDYGCVWFDFDVGNWYGTLSDSVKISVTGVFHTPQNEGGVVGIDSSSSKFGTPTDAKKLYENIRDGKGENGNGANATTGQITGKDKEIPVALEYELKGRYVRVYYMAWDNGSLSAINFYACTLSNVKVSIERTLKSYTVEYNKNTDSSTGTVDSTSHKYMEASNVSSAVFSGKDQYFTNWNTSADGSGVAIESGASTGTSTNTNTFGGVVKSNLQNGQTTTTLYAQYKEIPFVFNGTPYATYNPITKLVVLENTENYMSSQIDGYDTSITYQKDGVDISSQPKKIGTYTATITVKKGGVVRGTRTVEFEVVEGDFGKIQGGTGKWGSVTNPYVISNVTHLKNLSAIVNGRDALNSIVGSNNNSVTAEDVVATDKTYKDCYFVISANLGADTPIELVPIGKDNTHYFAGTIFGGNDSDANNRTMRTINLNIQQSGVSNVGLFGYVKGATISHLTTAGTIVGGAAVGGLVGYADGVTISNCRNNATVTGAYMIGGLVGFGNNVTITSSVNNADITGEYNKAGTPSGLTKGAYVGGFVGVVNGGSIANCYNNGNISASGDNSDFLGGIAGYTTAPISYCASLKDKTIEGSNQVGGIVGKASGNNAKIEYCYFGGKINGLWNDNSAKLDFICAEKEDGSSVSNSWKLSSAIQGAMGNRQYTNAGHSIQVASAFTLSPSYFDGTEYTPYTAVDGWQNILTVNINAFQILGGTESGKFLALHDGSNKSTLPNKTVIGKEKNSTGSPAKTDLVVNFIVYYNADTKQNVVAELKDIKIDAAAVDYNATEQYVVDNTQLPTTVNTHYFKQSFYFDQNGGGNATLGKTNAGTYKVYSDVWIRANNTDYLVGRKESTWTIKKLRFTIDNNQFFYGQDIENAIKNQIVIKNQSNVSVPKGAYTVVFGFNDTEHNFYGSIDIDQNQKEFSVAKTIISIYDSSNTLINDNFDINGFSVIVKAGDFGVQNNGINKSNIENNLWGSENNPYIIGTRDQLVTLSNIVRGAINATNSWYTSDVYKYVKGTIASYGGAYFKLARSIASIGNITPIGTISNVFAATFDGNNNNLSGLNISVAGNNVGLFGYISGATIKNLTVNGSVKGSQYVGGVVGYALNSTIENVTNNASISSTYKDAPYEIKQFDAHPYDANEQAVSKVNDGNLNSKYYSAKKGAMSFIVQNTTLAYIFGFAITNANDTNNTAEIQKRTPQSVKIWGSNNDFTRGDYDTGGGNTTVPNEWGWEVVYDSTLAMPSTNSYRKEFFSGFKLRNYKYYYIYVKAADNYSTLQFAEFDLLTTNSQNVGGVVGYANGTNIKNATNNASVEGDTSVGGIVGYADSTSRMYGTIVNSGNITANSMVGGVSGENHGFWCDTNSNYGTFKNSGSINGRNGATVGGVTAFADKEMRNAFNTGNVIGGNAVGGVAGRVQAPIKNSYNSGEIVGTNPTAQGEISVTPTPNGVFVGGITGYTTVNGTISNCYNKGHIAAHSASGDYINNGDYVGGIVGFAQAKVEYCANIGGLIEGNNFIGGIVGSALDNTNIDYCYDVQGQRKFRWDGCNHGSITGSGGNVTNSWAINEKQAQTTANNPNPVVSTKGYRLTTAFAVTPQVDLQNTTNQKWEDILSSKINGFKVVGSVAKNEFFCSDNGSDTNTKYVKPSKTEGFAGDNGDVTAWYSATIESNIRVRVQNIDIDNKSSIYDNAEHTFDFTLKPSQSANSANVYAVQFAYLGRNYGEFAPKDVDVYDTTITVKIGDQVVGVKTGVTYTIEKAALNVGWEWTDNLHANLYDRTGNGDKVQFVYNGKAQGLDSVSEHLRDVQLFDVTGNALTNTNAATYTRTYTLKDTRNYKLQNANNNNADLSGTTVTFEWKIRKNKLTVFNRWVAEDFGKDSNLYTFEYNTTHRGLLTTNDAITFLPEKATDNTRPEFKQGTDYTISEHQNAINVGEYSRTVRIINTNYEVNNTTAYVGSSSNATVNKGISVNGLVVTYTWKIVPYSLATNITSGNVWFGGRTDLIVGNQGIANVNVGNQSYADKRFYPLQSEQNGVQKVLVYAQHNYAADKFVLYVKYNNGTVAVLTQGTEYTLSELAAPTVENPAPLNTSVTASGKGNFDGDITKYYTAMFSDFGWKDGKTPEDNDWGGSADNPYVISKPEHLLRLSQIVNGGTAWNSINTTDNALCIAPQTTAKATSRDYKDAYFLVTVDIDMSGYISTDGVYNFLPIGTRSTQNQTELPFSATFDGGDNTITYVYNVGSFYNVDGARTNYVGLFGYLNGATISNLKVASNGGLSITDNSGIVGIEYVGGIAGYAVDSTLYNSVLAYGGWVRGETYVGGIVGYGERITIVSSEAVSSANVGGETYVGGIVGKWIVSNQSQIGGSVAGQRYVTPADQIDVMGIKYVGGIAGWMDTSSCATTISYAPQLNNNGKDGNFIVVGGIEYVGALFGAFIGNGYHQNATNDKYTAIVIDKDASDNFKVGNVKVILQNLNDKSASGNAKVVGGLVGYAEGVGILFNTDWTTSNVTLDTGNYTPSFIGGIAGVLGKNATIEAIYQLKDDGTFLSGGTHTITHSVPDEQKTFGTAAKPLGSFVGGIVGYVSSQAGVYWETGTTIFGNGISLVNSATIYATSYAGGIFGALGDLSTSVAQTFENDTNSILYNVLTTGVRSGNASTTLGLAPTVSGNGITAQGRLVNNASISVSGSYVGGIAGYGGAKVRFVLRNTPQDSAIDVSKLNIYSGGSDIFINGSYAGGIAGYLVDNLEHDLQYIVVKARFNTNNQSATRVGGLVGYMGSGNVQNCVVTNGGSSAITASTDTYQGSEYVGGLVGETQNATIRNSVSTGFNLEKTSNTKGGLLGGGTNPTIDSSWTFYIAKKRTNFAKNATPNGAYYATVSQSPYGKYILVDEGLINATEASYPTFASLCGFVGLLTNANVEGTLEFAVKVPNKTLNSNYENTQLAFYNASGSDTVTDNVDSFSKFENNNNTLTIALDMASGNSMQICVVGIEFVNVPQKNDTDTDKTTVVEGTYRKPSNSDKYIVHVTTANFNSERQITKIVATVYFECNGNLPVVIGSAYDDKRNIGGYDETFTPGSSATTPYTISTQEEWNDFAYSVYGGRTYIDANGNRQYVKLLVDVTVGSGYSSFANNSNYNFAGDVSKDSNENNFRGVFDGNGHTITVSFSGIKQDRASVFPNASGAIFRNLTIAGTICSNTATSDTDYAGKWNAGYDVAGFVGKPFGDVYFYNCTNRTNVSGLRNAGGFVGYTEHSVYAVACVNKGDIYTSEGINTNSESDYSWVKNQLESGDSDYKYANVTFGTGGIIGNSNLAQTIESCMNTGNISGGHNVGGIIGRANGDLTINNCANVGDILAHSGAEKYGGEDTEAARKFTLNYAGGIVGKTSKNGTINMYASYNKGTITAWGSIVGGLIGSVGNYIFANANLGGSDSTQHKNDALAKIFYCYNTGLVQAAGTYGKTAYPWTTGRLEVWGSVAGGIVGSLAHSEIRYCYNTGEVITHCIIGGRTTWQSRVGGIAGQVLPNENTSEYVLFDSCYNTGLITIDFNGTGTGLGGIGYGQGKPRYGAPISGYLDIRNCASQVTATNCFALAYTVRTRNTKRDEDNQKNYTYFREYNKYNSIRLGESDGYIELMQWGTVLDSLADFTAVMNTDGTVKPNSAFGTTHSASVESLTDETKYKAGTALGYVYAPGCLPQLAVFAVDTHNGLSMRSIDYGQNIYGEYREQKTGEEYSPYVIRDGIDLLGVQTLVDLGYTFENEYIEFANGTNNITLDKVDSSVVSSAIDMPTSDSPTTKLPSNTTAYKSKGTSGNYTQTGKSYHLFSNSAICGTAPRVGVKSGQIEGGTTEGANTAYTTWLERAYYYDGAYNYINDMANTAVFKVQNMIAIGRNGKLFKGSISGEQSNGTNTVINNLRIMTGKTTGGAYSGLFGQIENAYIGYIEVSGDSRIWSFSANERDISSAGGIVGSMLGSSTVEHCAISGKTSVGAFGKADNTTITSDITFAGGIVGLADTKQGDTYNAGIVGTTKDCIIDITTANNKYSGIISGSKSNIGGVLGYVGGDAGANGKGNSVRIEGCEVQKAAIQAASSANTSSQIGGILGYGSEFVAAFITGCKVGVGGTVSIKGEHSLGGIAGGMSNAKGGYIDSCTVGANTTIERIAVGNDNTVLESPKHGTAIGGLVGFTQDSKDDTSPLTTTFSGTSAFGGTITVSVEATNKSQDSDAKISCIGGIVGDMGSGANFASGSNVTVGGNINITLAAANVGGVVGRTNKATFIGKFNVAPNMSTENAENVGGFIGKNIGTVYILADTTDKLENTTVGALNGTEITIGGKIKGTSEVGGFIGVNNSGSTLNIGSNIANAKAYKSGTLEITITASVTGSHDNVGGIVGKNEGVSGQDDYAIVDIVKGTIKQNGAIKGANNVGGIIGLNDGLLTTGGGAADTTIGGVMLSEEQQNKIKNLSINNTGSVTGTGDYVGGVVGKLDSPSALRTEDSGKGAIAGTFTNSGNVSGGKFVGGSLGYVGKNVTITAKNNVATLFVNDGQVTATGYYAGGSIGVLVGKIEGVDNGHTVNFKNTGTVTATGFVGGSIGVLAGPVKYAQFVNSSGNLSIAAVNAVGGSVGFIGVPTPLETILTGVGITLADDYVKVENTHFEASGELTANPDSNAISVAKDAATNKSTGWGGVGGAIGVIGKNVRWGTEQNKNTYYANGNVTANGINNVGGIVGIILAENVNISNMLAYNTTVKGGENVGGIVGATDGIGTVITSAYAIEGTFTGSKNVGGIIGLAKPDTDASTSYWVKGYANAILAGTDVKNLQQDLGKFETIIEYVGEQPIVFTEDFCKMYTPKTYYDDYPGTHTYNGKTITLGENVEQLTWYDYFKDKLGETSAQIKNGAWVKPIANAPTYTTGANNTGWYFVYATDKTIGTIKAEHSTNANLQYWKRIADAYTSSERNEGKDDNVKNPLASDIVLGNGAPQKSTLYATATAAGTESGYYLYMATSGKSRPSATNQGNKFYIQTLTTNADALAENVAVYYRTISKGKALTFNGYLRYAPVGITASEGETVSYIKNPETATGKPNSYCYSADTTTAGGQGTDGAQTNPGSFHSQVNIYYFDSEGKPHVVGGVAIGWTINKRDLTAEFTANTDRTYGEDRKQEGDGTVKHDMKLAVGNIAPEAGKNAGIVITISSDNESYTFTWDGTRFDKTSAGGIVISAEGMTDPGATNGWDASDSLYNVDNPADKQTKDFSCFIDFTNAKTYTISVTTTATSGAQYTLDKTTNFSVKQATLTLKGVPTTNNPDSVIFNNKTHAFSWKVEGFKYNDDISQLALFSPTAYALGKSAPLFNGGTPNTMKTGSVTIDGVENVTYTIYSNSNSIDISGARDKGEYYIGFATLSAGNYKLKLDKGVESLKQSIKLSISDNELTFDWRGAGGSHPYDKKTKGTITLTITAKSAIDGFENFVKKFFAPTMSGTGANAVWGTASDNKSITITFTTGVNAGTYTATIAQNKNETAFIEANKVNCSYPMIPQSRSYKIDKRNLTITLISKDNKTSYTYNGQHQGLVSIRVNSASGSTGLISGDSVNATVSVSREGTEFGSISVSAITSSTANNVRLSTINFGKYIATVTMAENTNYTCQQSGTLEWEIKKYQLTLSDLTGGQKVYDGIATKPTLKVNGVSVDNGEFTPSGVSGDRIAIKYSASIDGQSYESIVNAGKYSVSIGGNGANAITVSPATRDGINTADNYSIEGGQSVDYVILPRTLKLSWQEIQSFVFSNTEQGLIVIGVEGVEDGGNGSLAVKSGTSTINGVKLTGYAGGDTIEITIIGALLHANSTSKMEAKITSVSGTNKDGSNSIEGNYTLSEDDRFSGEFTITPSVVSIKFNAPNATLTKVYDGNRTVPTSQINDSYFSWSATGYNPTRNPFKVTAQYDNKNVGDKKAVMFSYAFTDPTNVGDYVVGTVDGSAYTVGQITPAHIKVALDKLRSGKATRTYTDDEFYGGAEGANVNGRSKTYRTGEGFTVSGVLGSDNINVVARYQEADNTRNSNSGNYFDFSKYVNDVYKEGDVFKKATAGTYFKKLVFTMTGTDAANYTFNVYDSSAEGGNKYSESDSTAAAIQSVTVYDSRDSKNKNASGAASIQIEITVKSVRVEYSDTAQSYANDDNTYNTDWKPITGTNKDMDKADAKIKVSNGWMYADGKDHTAEEGYTKREYRGYTTIRGSQNSERLGAKVDPTNGMDLNYRLSNQPTLTIAYFVSTGDEYEINSLARLLIASFYYTASQNPGNLEIIKIVSSGYKWVSVVSADDYDKGEFELPQDTPITDSKATTWDEYFTELEAKGYSVFLNIEANAQDNIPANTWGYYATTTSESSTIPTSYKLTKDIVGKFTESDISILNTFFTVIGDDGKTTTSTWSGNGTYLKNVLKAAEGKIATINGSLFVSTAKTEGAGDVTGFGGTFDGNGYVIEYLNIMGYGKDNVGLFDVIGANGIVKNLHLRNVTINGNAKYIGGIAGKVLAAADALTEKSVKNVSFYGSINVTGSTDQSVGGLFGTSERAVENAIVLGSITVSNVNAKVGGVVGSSEQGMSNVVSLMQIDANCNVGAFSQTNRNVTNSYHLQNAVWRRNGSSITFVNHANAKTYDELMSGSVSGYGTTNKYYHESETSVTKGEYDVLDDVVLTKISVDNKENARQSMRLADIVKVYLLMYSLNETQATDSGNLNGANVYAISTSSWLVGTADGTTAKPIAIANKQNVSLLRELRFASFTLKANVSIEIASTFSGAFYGSVTSATNESGTSYGYKITCDKAMFEAYSNDASAWLSVQQ